MDLIKFGWSAQYAVDREFDLNQLRYFTKIKEKGKKYVTSDDADENIFIKVNIDMTEDKEEIEKIDLEEITKDRDNYKRWYQEGQSEFTKAKKELECLKASIEIMKKEKKDETDL